MATTAMDTDMAQNHKWLIYGLVIYALAAKANGGEWEFTPNLVFEETYTDNVELEKNNKTTSYVSQYIAGIETQFNSRLAEFSLDATGTYATYTHNHDLDDDFRTLNANGRLALWTEGPAIVASASINNVSKNSANNSLADLVSGDTVEYRSYMTGIEYNIENSKFLISSSLKYNIHSAEDDIGESNGYTAAFNTSSKNENIGLLWQVDGFFTKRENNDLSGETYNAEALLGIYTGFNFTPLLRFYDEDSSGDIASSTNTSMTSFGPGFRWKVSPHFFLDMSYNYVEDKKLTDDYLTVAVNWQPSQRTSLTAEYSQRFYGDSYDFEFEHKIKRLKNTISYNETIDAFDRNSYQQVLLGNYWCPESANLESDFSDCFLSSNTEIDFEQFQLFSLYDQELIEGNEFSLNKTLSWQTQLTLSRTTFSLSINNRERESLNTGRQDDSLSANMSITRKVSGKSDFTITADFRREEFDKSNPETNGQNDYYRTVATTYTRQLARTLSTNFTLQYLDRSSSEVIRTYEEVRAIFNISKDF